MWARTKKDGNSKETGRESGSGHAGGNETINRSGLHGNQDWEMMQEDWILLREEKNEDVEHMDCPIYEVQLEIHKIEKLMGEAINHRIIAFMRNLGLENANGRQIAILREQTPRLFMSAISMGKRQNIETA